MFSLVIAILFGLSITFFAFQNSVGIPIVLGNLLLSSVPVYLVVIVSVLVGIFMAWFISALDGVSHFMNLRKKDSVINQDKKEIIALRQKVSDLQRENAKHVETKREVVVEHRQVPVRQNIPDTLERKPSIFERIFPNSTRHYSKQV